MHTPTRTLRSKVAKSSSCDLVGFCSLTSTFPLIAPFAVLACILPLLPSLVFGPGRPWPSSPPSSALSAHPLSLALFSIRSAVIWTLVYNHMQRQCYRPWLYVQVIGRTASLFCLTLYPAHRSALCWHSRGASWPGTLSVLFNACLPYGQFFFSIYTLGPVSV